MASALLGQLALPLQRLAGVEAPVQLQVVEFYPFAFLTSVALKVIAPCIHDSIQASHSVHNVGSTTARCETIEIA